MTSYGQEIMILTSSQERHIANVYARAYRMIFNQSFSARVASMQRLTGQLTAQSKRIISRTLNFLRIEQLPRTRTIKALQLDWKDWPAQCTLGAHTKDIQRI